MFSEKRLQRLDSPLPSVSYPRICRFRCWTKPNNNGIRYEFPFSGGKNADAENQLENDVPDVKNDRAVCKIYMTKFAWLTFTWASKLPLLKRDYDAFADNL